MPQLSGRNPVNKRTNVNDLDRETLILFDFPGRSCAYNGLVPVRVQQVTTLARIGPLFKLAVL